MGPDPATLLYMYNRTALVLTACKTACVLLGLEPTDAPLSPAEVPDKTTRSERRPGADIDR